jgi:hypothetical protein
LKREIKTPRFARLTRRVFTVLSVCSLDNLARHAGWRRTSSEKGVKLGAAMPGDRTRFEGTDPSGNVFVLVNR